MAEFRLEFNRGVTFGEVEAGSMGQVTSVRAVMFDFSGTLFRLEKDDAWFDDMGLAEHVQAELMARLTHPTSNSVHMTDEAYQAWLNRDLVPSLHREAYLHVLRSSGLSDPHAESLYQRVIDPASWSPYPDTAEVFRSLRAQGISTAVVSNIAYDVRPALVAAGAEPDHVVLSYEVGFAKPDPQIFHIALDRCRATPAEALMVGDSAENDGAATNLGCTFALVDPIPIAHRPTGLVDALRDAGITV